MNIFTKDTNNCLVCVIKPAIIFGISSYCPEFECRHTDSKVEKPRFKQNELISFIYLIINSVIFLGLGISVYELVANDYLDFENTFKYAVLAMKLANSTIISVTLYVNQKNSIKYMNVLADLIDNRKLYGVEIILTTKITRMLLLLLLFTICCTSIGLLVYLVDSIHRSFTVKDVILSFACSIRTLNYLNYAFIGGLLTIVYRICLDTCCAQIQNLLSTKTPSTDFLQQLQTLQRFYLANCRNYKRQFRSLGNIVFYAQEFAYGVLMCVQCYFYYAYIKESEIFNALTTNYNEFDNFFVWFAFPVFIWLVATVSNSSQNLKSFLHGYSMSKLSASDALQVEMLLITMEAEKPILTPTDLFAIGTNLIPSVCGTAVTYVLVALQFNPTFSHA